MNKPNIKVEIGSDDKDPNFFLSFRVKVTPEAAGKIVSYIGALPANEKKIMKAKTRKI